MHTLKIDGISSDIRLIRFEGSEGLSELFQFSVLFISPDGELAFDDIIGKSAVLSFHVGEDIRFVHGSIAEFEQREEGKKQSAYNVLIVPDAARLQYRKNSRIFQNMSAPDIISQVLSSAGLQARNIRKSLSASYVSREYCVQYRESDWAFVSRLMEEEGIFYFFEHTDSAHTLVIADSPSVHPNIPGDSSLRFHPPTGALMKGEHVSRFRYAERLRSGKVSLRDYNFKKPSLALDANSKAKVDDDLEVYDFPGVFDAPGAGSNLAKVRLESLQALRKTADGESACPRFCPGAKFTLDEHPRDEFNREYVLLHVHHEGFEPSFESGGEGSANPYQNRFRVIPSDVPFRAPPLTPKPSIKGIQTAIVTGPGGEEIHTDEHGRIKVQFHWDREGKKNENSSCWIRVAQLWAGPGWGALFIPRIGQEVVVDFLEGDPDRPLVVGAVYHGTNVPPYSLPADKTKSTIKTNSSVGGGGFNEIRFEDKAGSEEIYIHGQKDWTIVIEHDKDQAIGNDEALHVMHDREKRVDNNQSESIGANKHIDVGGDHDEQIKGSESLSVGGDRDVSVAGNHIENVAGEQMVNVAMMQSIAVGLAQSVSVGASMSLAVGAGKSETVGASSSESVGKSKSVQIDENYSLSVVKNSEVKIGKDAKEEVSEKKTLIVGKKLSIQCGDAQVVLEKNGNISVKGKKITVKGEGPIQVEGKKLQVKSEGAVNVEASGKIKVKGSQVGIN